MEAITRLLFLSFSVVLILQGCDWVDDDHEAHTDAEGFQIVLDDRVVVQWRENVITGSVPLEVSTGQTQNFSIRFLDHDGHVVEADHIDANTVMTVELSDPTLAGLLVDEANPWSFSLTGKKAGDTELRIGLRHGPDHFDFTPRAIPVRVVA